VASFLICAQPLAGHVRPALPIARALAERGHDVRFYTSTRYRRQVEAAGARHVGPSAAPDFDGDLDAAFPQRARLSGLARSRWDLGMLVTQLSGQLADIEGHLGDAPADVVLTEPTMLAGYALWRRHGLPWATFGTTALTLPDPAVPPHGLGLRFSPSRAALVRNRLFAAAAHQALFKSLDRLADAELRAHGVRADRTLLELTVSPLLHLQPGTPSMDYPRRNPPPQVRYAGALVPPDSPGAELPPGWRERLVRAGRVVLVTEGTLGTGPERLVSSTVAAFAGDSRTVVVGNASRLGPGKLPPHALIAPHVPHALVLPHADVFVTNGGYGGALAALSHGVPVVAAPAGEEKPEIARRIAYTGAGLDLRTPAPGPARIRSAVERVLTDPAFRTTARRIAADLRALDGPRQAAILLEDLHQRRHDHDKNSDRPPSGR
jgi:UDP:flavonoid glycosyltransferase YjiC (YdhE family)